MLRSGSVSLMIALVGACGPGTAETATMTTGVGGSTGTVDVSASGSTLEPTSGGVTTTVEPTTATTGPGETTATITSTTTTSDATSGGGTTGTPPGGGACVTDDDCKLHDDCCTCAGVAVDADVSKCDDICKQSKCSEYGIDAAICRLGVCITERLSCDTKQVDCMAAPPDCGPDHLPETTTTCWTGKCVPASACDVVPDCALCPAEMMCVTLVGEAPLGSTCEPIPLACEGTVDCACVAEQVCIDAFSLCSTEASEVNCHCGVC